MLYKILNLKKYDSWLQIEENTMCSENIYLTSLSFFLGSQFSLILQTLLLKSI